MNDKPHFIWETDCGDLKVEYRHHYAGDVPSEPREHCDIEIELGGHDVKFAIMYGNPTLFAKLQTEALKDYWDKKRAAAMGAAA